MNTSQIHDILKKFPMYKGVYSCDRLPEIRRFPASYIINTAPSNHPGEHWVACHFDRDGDCEYFDSFGLRPVERRINGWLQRHARSIEYSSALLQDTHPQSAACGPFSISFVALKHQGLSLNEIISFFSKHGHCNDMIATTMTWLFKQKEYKP